MFIFEFIANFFIKLWSKGEIVSRIDFNSYYRKFAYPTPFIERHKSAKGVNEIFKKLKIAHNSFKERRAEIINQESRVEQQIYSIWLFFHLVKIVSKRTLLICAFIGIALMIALSSVEIKMFDNLANIITYVFFLSIPCSFISKCAEKIMEVFYNKYSARITKELTTVKLEYFRIENECREEMDKLCLASLSKQELTEEIHHREMIALQEKNAEMVSAQLKNIQKENKKHNRAVEEDLRKFKEKMGIED